MADTPEMGRTPSTDELVPELTFDEIDRAFDNNEFCFYLQPKCNAATGAIVGAEALVRWNHPKYGVVSPGRFVPMLEQAGQISRLDVFVWRSVVRMLARWEREGRNLVPISVNVSMVDIDQMDVADTLTGLLNEYESTLGCSKRKSPKAPWPGTCPKWKAPSASCMRTTSRC